MSMPPPSFQPQHNFHQPRWNNSQSFHHNKPFYKSYKHGMQVQDDFDGKRLRKSVMRKTVDYNSSIIKALEVRNWKFVVAGCFLNFFQQNRVWQRDQRDRRALQPENCYIPDMMPPSSYLDNPSNAITTRFVKTATNKMRCPIFTLAWTPEGRRLITGASSGEFTLWNGLTFNFETILQVSWWLLSVKRKVYRFFPFSGPHCFSPSDGLVTQRQLDGDRRSQRLCQVLAVEHEPSSAVSSAQGAY